MAEHDVEDCNPLPDCAGLELSVPQGGDRGTDVWLNAYLTFGSEQISDEAVCFTLGVKEGNLRLNLENCKIVFGTRYGELQQPSSIPHKQTVEEIQQEKSQVEGRFAAGVKAITSRASGEAEAKASASRGRSKEHTLTTTRERQAETRKVTARGTHSTPSWEFVEPEDQRLNGTYLGPEDLCQLVVDKGCYEVTARFVCRKRDLVLEIDPYPRWNFVPRNKHALALAVIAKELGQDDLDGEVELCRSTLASRPSED